MSANINFEEISSNASEFLHELEDPDLLRNDTLSPDASGELRRQQVGKIRENIGQLRAKQDEFNRHVEGYVRQLENIIEKLGARKSVKPSKSGETRTTRVSCLKCQRDASFDMEILFARESDECISSPTPCYVSESGMIKKGVFRCDECGSADLRIQVG